jgi:hypothetical protein
VSSSKTVFAIAVSGKVGTVIVVEAVLYSAVPTKTRRFVIRSPLKTELPATHQVQCAQLIPTAVE